MLNIKNHLNGDILKINAFWLRDHCFCSLCFHNDTRQRKCNLLNISPDIQPKEVCYKENGQIYQVLWNDGHLSTYDINFLCEFSQINRQTKHKTLNSLQKPWDTEFALKNEPEMRVKLTELINSKEKVTAAVDSLLKFGILFIDDVPPDTVMTEMAMRRLFPIMKTFFGEMWTFSDQQDHADTAYTKLYIGAHTDNSYFCDAAGLHSLHCIEHEGGAGGENFFVDGLKAVLELKNCNRHAYEVLSKVSVPAEYIEAGQHHKYTAPIICLNDYTGHLEQLRLNIYDRAVFNTLHQQQMHAFYESLRAFLEIVQRKQLEWTFKLQPGTYVIFDNWRILHGRHAYSGKRTMTGCYVQRTDFLSRARTLGLLD